MFRSVSVRVLKRKSEGGREGGGHGLVLAESRLEQVGEEGIPACTVQQVVVCVQLFSQLQLVVVHELVVDYDQQRFASTESLQTTSCS